MSVDRTKYKFGDFELDPSESSLLRSGDAVPITPKALSLLSILVKNRGNVLDKAYLLDHVWADSFVEEGNLTFNIRQLRKILGDEVKNPKFIETVPKRGYRFIGSVQKIDPSVREFSESIASVPLTLLAEPESARRSQWKPWFLAIPVIFVAGGFAAVESWFGILSRDSTLPKLLSTPFSSQRLSTDGNVRHPTLSKSGEFMVYVAGNDGEKQSVRVRDLASGQSRELLGSTDDQYRGLEISNDDSTVYFVRVGVDDVANACLFKVKLIGGIPELLSCGVQGWFDISNDGKLISYVRCKYVPDDFCSLYVSDENFGNERLLVTRTNRDRIADNAISPDGQSVVFVAGQSVDGSNAFGIYKIDLETNAETPVVDQKFFNILNIDWIPDSESLLATGLLSGEDNTNFWTVDPITRTATPMKHGHDFFKSISIDRDGSKLASTIRQADFRIFVHSISEETKPALLGNGWTPRFSSDGRILFASDRSGKVAVWSAGPDGTDFKHLSSGSDHFPILSPDSSTIYFSSIRSGKIEVWKMRPDGSEAKQLSQKAGGFPVGVSPDGFWIYYLSAMNRTLFRVSNEGSSEEELSELAMHGAVISADGRTSAFIERNSGETKIALFSIEERVKMLAVPLPGRGLQAKHLDWSANGSQIYAVLIDPKAKSNSVWRIPIDGSPATKIRDLNVQELGERSSFSVSPDEKYFAISLGQFKHDAVLIHGLK